MLGVADVDVRRLRPKVGIGAGYPYQFSFPRQLPDGGTVYGATTWSDVQDVLTL